MNKLPIITAAVQGPVASGRISLLKFFEYALQFKHLGILALGLFLAACGADQTTDYIDTDAALTKEQFKQGMAAQEAPPSPPPPPIPELQAVISTPTLSAEIQSRRVTVTITETTPLKDVLIELAREARIGLELDPRIEGGVIFSAYDRPFEQVLKRLSDLAGLRYSLNNGVMRIELDDPYHVNYKLGYLSLVRSATSEVSTASTVVGGDDDEGGGGGGASSSTVNNVSEVDFWAELTANLTQILTNTATRTGLVAVLTPELVAVLPAPAPQPTAETEADSEDTDLAGILARLQADIAVDQSSAQQLAALSSASASGALAQAAAASATGAAIPSLTPAFAAASSLFTVNRQAGIVSVFGTERQHRQIETYLRWLRKSISAQVLIEAKILEVTLDDEFRFGVNWATFFDGRLNAAAPFNTATTPLIQPPPFGTLINPQVATNALTGDLVLAPVATPNVLTFAFGGADLNVIANVAEKFGTVRALSSPRLTVMQNQTAVLKVATERVFFSQEVTPGGVTDSGTGDSLNTSVINTVTVGLIMTVQPSINLDTDEITLTLRPTITRVANFVQDAITLNQIPELGVQEIDSVITIPSGNVIIMGGLMQDRSTVTEVGIPLLSDIPWLGQAFKSTDRDTRKTELVIFLRATILQNAEIDAYDIQLYDQFGKDRRPLVFD